MALRCFVVLITKEMSGGIARRLISTTAARSHFLSESPNAHLNKNLLNRYTRLKYDPKNIQVRKNKRKA